VYIQQKLAALKGKNIEFEEEFSVSSNSKSKQIKLRLKFRMETGIPYVPKADSKSMFQLDSDLVWDTDLTVAVSVMGINIEITIVSLRLPLRVTLEWLNYEVNMRKCPIMPTCGNDFVEFRRRWQEWADSGHWPMPVRLWLDLRAYPSIETKIKSSGVGDIWKLPGMQNIKEDVVCKIVYDLFPIPINLGDPAPVAQHTKPAINSKMFSEFMDSNKNGGMVVKAVLKLRVFCASTDPTLPIQESNYYCVVRYGRMLKLEPPLDKEILLNENLEQLRFSHTQWTTHEPQYSDEFLFDIEDPGNDMIAFELYRINPKLRNNPKSERRTDTLVLKRKFRFSEFIDNFGVIVYPRNDTKDPNRKSLRRMIEINDGYGNDTAKLTVIAQIITHDAGAEQGETTNMYTGASLDDAPGLRWEEIGSEILTSGTQITNEALESALRRRIKTLTKEELDSFKISNLSYHCYIKVDDKYFKPCGKQGDPVGIRLDKSHVGKIAGKDGQRGCPGTLLVQLSAPSEQTEAQMSQFASRNLDLKLLRNENTVVDRVLFHETPDDALKVTRSTMGPVFHFEISGSCCSYSVEVGDGTQSVKMPLAEMLMERDGFFEIFPKDLRPGNKNPPDQVPFPAIVASFLPELPKLPTVALTIHHVNGMPWYSGKTPPDAFCRVVIKKERGPDPPEESVKSDSHKSAASFKSSSPAPIRYENYQEYIKLRESVTSLPLFDGGPLEISQTTQRLQGKTDSYFGDTFTVDVAPEMLHRNSQFQQLVYVEVLQVLILIAHSNAKFILKCEGLARRDA
jgi:hypothetical protein